MSITDSRRNSAMTADGAPPRPATTHTEESFDMTNTIHNRPITTENVATADISLMRAVVQDHYGLDALRTATVERPALADDEVLVRVAGAGVDRGVWHLATGLPYLTRAAFGIRRPRNPVPGLELSGVVEAVGPAVTAFAEGDRVFGVGRGTFAEYAAASESKLAAVPRSLDLVHAGPLAVSGSAALQAVEDHGGVVAGMHVLVLGGSGGVGTYAVQIAKALGATVTGVAGGDKTELVRSIGADRVLDYRREDPLAGDVAYDVIIDTGGNRGVGRLARALTPSGTLVIVGGENGGRLIGGVDRQVRAKLRSIASKRTLTTFIAKEDAAHLERLADLVDVDGVRPVLDRRFRLDEAGDALRHLESGRTRGKVVLDLTSA